MALGIAMPAARLAPAPFLSASFLPAHAARLAAPSARAARLPAFASFPAAPFFLTAAAPALVIEAAA